jgi:hypothetical protein
MRWYEIEASPRGKPNLICLTKCQQGRASSPANAGLLLVRWNSVGQLMISPDLPLRSVTITFRPVSIVRQAVSTRRGHAAR